jgi:dolichol-phosphate mannosyltransferase
LLTVLPVPALACPKCHGDLAAGQEENLVCAQCHASYPVLDGIPSFMEGQPRDPAASFQLTVLVPALNEAPNLDQLLPNLHRVLGSLEITHELLVVDGGSADDTATVVSKNNARLVLQRLPGYGGALRTGFEEARGEYVVTLDADGSHDPDLLLQMWAARADAEMVISSRYIPGGGAEMPRWRYVLSRILNVVFRRGLSLPVRDLSSGYRLYRRTALKAISLRGTDFNVLEEILIRILAAGYRVREVPFLYRARLSGKSHIKLFKFGLSYLNTFASMWQLRNSIASADYDSRAYDSMIPLQRYWQRRRYQVITRMSAGFESVLDAGCGSSRILGSRQMVGLDVVLGKLRYGRRFGNPMVHGSIFALPFKDASFDCVICSEVIEHVPADEKVFDELERVLKPGGRLVLGTPDYDRWRWRALEWVYGRLSPGGYADEHITHYSRGNLEAYLKSRGFKVEELDYVGGSEMIFSLRKAAAPAEPARRLPVASGLRSIRARVAAH